MSKTVLFDQHKSLGAKIIDFHGWSMPISYESVIKEHKTVRSHCGVFDVSHMGQVFVSGEEALNFLQYVTMNNLEKVSTGCAQYSGFLNESGGFVDDIIIYKIANTHFLICVNASNIEKDVAWLERHSEGFDVLISNESTSWSQIALQGPEALSILKLADSELCTIATKLEFMQFQTYFKDNQPCYIARTGYTGEFGFELYIPNSLAVDTWQKLIKAGAVPIGLGARDTLRLEASMPLYGNDIDADISPVEAGLKWAVDLEKGNFVGKSALIDNLEKKAYTRKLVCFSLAEKGIARADMGVYHNDKPVGKVTSGSVLPSLDKSGGFALIEMPLDAPLRPGDEITIDIRGKRKLAHIHKRPLYSSRAKSINGSV